MGRSPCSSTTKPQQAGCCRTPLTAAATGSPSWSWPSSAEMQQCCETRRAHPTALQAPHPMAAPHRPRRPAYAVPPIPRSARPLPGPVGCESDGSARWRGWLGLGPHPQGCRPRQEQSPRPPARRPRRLTRCARGRRRATRRRGSWRSARRTSSGTRSCRPARPSGPRGARPPRRAEGGAGRVGQQAPRWHAGHGRVGLGGWGWGDEGCSYSNTSPR